MGHTMKLGATFWQTTLLTPPLALYYSFFDLTQPPSADSRGFPMELDMVLCLRKSPGSLEVPCQVNRFEPSLTLSMADQNFWQTGFDLS